MKTVILILLCFQLSAQDSWKPAKDKYLHFGVGFTIGATTTFIAKKHPFIWSLATTSVIAGGKELYDATGKGTPSLADFTYTMVGGIAGTTATYFIRKAFIKKQKQPTFQ